MLKLTITSCSAYFFAMLCLLRWLVRPPAKNNKNYLFRLFSLISVSLHGLLLYQLIETPTGQNLHSVVLLSFMFWLLNITILFSVHLAKVENLSLFAYPITMLILIGSYIFHGLDVIPTHQYDGMVSHVILSMFSASTLCLAFLQALLLSIQNTLIKNHKPSKLLENLPPLQTTESLLFTFLCLGMLCLTLALFSGFWMQYQHPELSHQPEILLSLVSWAVIGLLLIGRYRLGWRLQKAVLGTTLGFTLILVSYFSTHL